MTDAPLSNIPGRVTASAEMLEAAVAELLRRIPETWQAYKPDDLSDTKVQALFLLTAAGMVERRERLRLRFAGHPVVAEATITMTGEYGGIEALEPLVANLWADWQDAFRAWKKGDAANVSPAHCERLEPSEWRLTPEGVTARQDLDGAEGRVFDFVLRRGVFDGRTRMVNGRPFRREPVRGKGALVKMDKTTADAAPAAINIGNWNAGGDAFAQAFEGIITKAFEKLQAQAEPAAPAEPKPKGELSRRATKVWDDFQDAIVKGKFDQSPPTDREVYDWLLVHRRKGEDMPKFDTWRRYLRQAREYHGCQKNTPRAGRAMGSSIDTESAAKPIHATEREHRIKRSINQDD